MFFIRLSLVLLTAITTSQASNIIYLENCTYSIDLYKQYLNLLWSSNDSRSLHIQAIYSLSSDKSLIPGQIYPYSSQSVALIPFFIQCTSFKNYTYLPFTQCSSTITNLLSKKNYESTRTNLYLKNLLSLEKVPVLYLGEYYLLLSNCSFQLNSTIYKLKSNEIFSFNIAYESSILSNCTSCNQRTSICYENLCQCRSGTISLKLHDNKQYCIDITKNCTLDSQRCLYIKTFKNNYSNEIILLLIILINFLFILFVLLLWYLYQYLNQNKTKTYANQSIEKHQRSPSTISTIDSIKLSIENQYPKIIGEQNNGEIVFILA